MQATANCRRTASLSTAPPSSPSKTTTTMMTVKISNKIKKKIASLWRWLAAAARGRAGSPTPSSSPPLISPCDLCPIPRLEMDGELPYRMAMHPCGEGFVCSFPESCRLFEWDFSENNELLTMKSSEKILENLEDVGQQLALPFDAEGSMLATGGEDGHMRVFKWPDMDIILDQTDAHTSVKDLYFSSDAKYLVSLGDSSPCRVWDLTSSVVEDSLQQEFVKGEVFGFCRFSWNSGENQMLYVTAMHGNYGKIISWNANTGKRVGSKKISWDSISAFSVSPDGILLAIGTVEGSIVLVNSSRLQLLVTVKKPHLGIITAVVFSKDSRDMMVPP